MGSFPLRNLPALVLSERHISSSNHTLAQRSRASLLFPPADVKFFSPLAPVTGPTKVTEALSFLAEAIAPLFPYGSSRTHLPFHFRKGLVAKRRATVLFSQLQQARLFYIFRPPPPLSPVLVFFQKNTRRFLHNSLFNALFLFFSSLSLRIPPVPLPFLLCG